MPKTVLLFLALFSVVAHAQTNDAIKVHIEILADSSNRITAAVEVAPNTNARELLDRLFKMEYMDFTKRFVVGIAGFKVSPREKKFWKLEIDGTEAQVGIAEVVIKHETRLRWSVARF